MLVNAEERNKQFTGVKAVITGKPGIGKTTLLTHLDPRHTLFIDIYRMSYRLDRRILGSYGNQNREPAICRRDVQARVPLLEAVCVAGSGLGVGHHDHATA